MHLQNLDFWGLGLLQGSFALVQLTSLSQAKIKDAQRVEQHFWGPNTATWSNPNCTVKRVPGGQPGPAKGGIQPQGERGNSPDHPGQSDWTSTNSRNLAQKYFHIRIATGISERFLNISQLSGFSVTS